MSDNNTDKRIEKLSDAEFLSFLYSERDRESSLRQYQGWTLWALAGALVTVTCAGYHILKGENTILCISQIIYIVSGVMATMLFIRPMFLLFERERGVDYKKIKILKNVAPYHYLGLTVAVSVTFSLLVPLFNKNNPFNIISIYWMICALMTIGGLIYDIVCREKIVKSDCDGMVFNSVDWNRRYSALLGGVLFTIGLESFINVNYHVLESPSFELAVCISAEVLLAQFMIKVYYIEKKANKIDILIDEYVYKDFPKDMTYRMLRMNRMGNTVLESCVEELLGLRNAFEAYEQKKQRIEEVCNHFEKETCGANKFQEYYGEVVETMAFLKQCHHQVEKLRNKLRQIEKQVPYLKTDKEFEDIMKVLYYHITKEEELFEFAKSTTNKIQTWLNKYHCNKYGGFCERECEHRHDKPLLRLRWKRLCNKLSSDNKDKAIKTT